MDASATITSEYRRSVDGIFGRVEKFDLKHSHRVQIKIGNSYFVSRKTYASLEAARRAASRIASSTSAAEADR